MPSLNVKVVPGAKANRVVGRYADGIKMQVSAPPEDGKANTAVIRTLAEALGLKPGQIEILRGHTQPRKVLNVTGIELADLTSWMGNLK